CALPICDLIFKDPFPVPLVAIVLPFPGQSFLAFVPFMGSGSGMSLGLREFVDMDNDGYVLVPGYVRGIFVRMDQGRIIPPLHFYDLVTVVFCIPLEYGQDFGNILFCRLVPGVDGNSVIVVPNTDYHGYLQYTCRINGLKEYPFAGACVADSSPGHFVPLIGEFAAGKTFYISIYFRGLGEAQ